MENHSILNCEKCGKNLGGKILCSDCTTLVKLTNRNNFFHIFELDQKFNIDKNILRQKYLKLQLLMHPDKILNNDIATQQVASNNVMIINEAYQTLLNDRKRAEYILSLNNIRVNSNNDNIHINHEDLMQILQTREEIEAAHYSHELDSIEILNNAKINSIFENFDSIFSIDLEIAAKDIIKLRYYEKIAEEINNKRIDNAVT